MALLVTAHPDDEAMFFVPTVQRIRSKFPSARVYLLCLSAGDYIGPQCANPLPHLGETRAEELRASWDLLNPPSKAALRNFLRAVDPQEEEVENGGSVRSHNSKKGANGTSTRSRGRGSGSSSSTSGSASSSSHHGDGASTALPSVYYSAVGDLGYVLDTAELVDHPELKDGPGKEWRADLIASLVARAVRRWNITTLITFDEHGVSGHCNHRDVYRGCMHMLTHPNDFEEARSLTSVLTLRSTNVLRKYTGILDVPFSVLFSAWQVGGGAREFVFVAGIAGLMMSFACMRAHRSQLLWFRYLFVLFSRYAYVNTLADVTSLRPAVSE